MSTTPERNYLARRTKEEAEETRNKILSAATKLFSEKGYFYTSLEDIAKAAILTRGAIYWHFKNKADIFDALHERLHSSFLETILQDLEKSHPHPLEQLQDLCIALLLDLESDAEKRCVLTLFLLRCDYSGELEVYQERHRTKKTECLKLFSRYFEKIHAQKMKTQEGYAQETNPDILALALSCYIKGIIVEYLNNPNLINMTEQAPALIKLFFHKNL